jgi:hypothetical protein
VEIRGYTVEDHGYTVITTVLWSNPPLLPNQKPPLHTVEQWLDSWLTGAALWVVGDNPPPRRECERPGDRGGDSRRAAPRIHPTSSCSRRGDECCVSSVVTLPLADSARGQGTGGETRVERAGCSLCTSSTPYPPDEQLPAVW